MATLMFRNVDADPSDPIDTWPHEAFQAAIEHGLTPDWQGIANHLDQHPYGAAAATLAEVLEYTEGVGAFLLRHRLERARSTALSVMLKKQAQELAGLVAGSGLTQRELARRIGTSESRLSTWLSGRQAPTAQAVAKVRLALSNAE